MINKAIIVGRLGNDPELRYTQSGSPVCNMSVATSEKRKNSQGEYEDKAEWHKVVVRGKSAENCSKFLSKGSLVYIEGKLQTRSWDDKNGVKKYTTEIVSFNVTFLDTKNNSSPGGGSDNYAPPESGDDAPF